MISKFLLERRSRRYQRLEDQEDTKGCSLEILNGIKEQLETQAIQSRRNVSRRVALGWGGDRRVLSSRGVGKEYPHSLAVSLQGL